MRTLAEAPTDILARCVRKGDCLVWQGGQDSNGYGAIVVEKKVIRVHVIMYAHYNGAPAEHEVCHTCDNPPCVEREHLFDATHADNMRDMYRKGRGIAISSARIKGNHKPYCKHGHIRNVENTYNRPNGRIECRLCIRARLETM